MRRVLIVGGANGIGLSLATILAGREEVEKVYIVDKAAFPVSLLSAKIDAYEFDLQNDDYTIFDSFADIDTLIITIKDSDSEIGQMLKKISDQNRDIVSWECY